MILGFTGTKIGMTAAQMSEVVGVTMRHPLAVCHLVHLAVHGDCVGADDDFDGLMVSLGIRREFYPSDAESYRARGDLKRPSADLIVHTPLPPLKRNALIVSRSDLVLACPKGPEERRSGTWSTVRLAVKRGKPVTIIWPDGTTTKR